MRSFLIRFIKFIVRYYKRPVYIVSYAFFYFNRSFTAKSTFFSEKKLLEELYKGKSFLRFGDGETSIMNGGSISWQKYEQSLDRTMRQAIQEYTSESPYIIGLPRFINETNKQLKKEGKFNVWLPLKVRYRMIFPKDAVYGDAHIFYYDGFFKKHFEEYFLDKYIIVIAHSGNIEAVKNNPTIPFKKMVFIEAPKIDSYSDYDRLCKEIDTILQSLSPLEKPVILAGIGPTSKCIVYQFSKQGIPSYDIGRGIEVIYKDESLETIYPELTSNKAKGW